MASTDARPIPIKDTAYRVTFPILDADGDLVTGAGSLDSEVSKDGGTFADCTNEATEIATSSGMYYLDLTSTEMNADTVAVIVKSSSGKTTPIVLYPQEAGDIKVDVESISGDTAAADNLESYTDGTTPMPVNAIQLSGDAAAADNAEAMFDGTGYAGGTIKLGVDVVAISGDATAADNLEAATDGGGYNIGGGSVVAASVTGAVGSVTGAVGSVTGNVGGNVTGSVGSVATGGITAGSIAADAIGASEIAADAVTEIQSGLATAAALATVDDFLDTEIAAIKAVTDALTAAAAAKLAVSAGVMVTGTVDNTAFTATTTILESDDITEATADHFNGRVIIFTSGALEYQATTITDYALSSGRGRFTYTALTEAPADNGTFIII